MNRNPIQTVCYAHLPKARAGYGGPHHPGDPLIAAARDVQNSIFMLLKEALDFLPGILLQPRPGFFGNLRIAFEQFEGHPILMVGLGNLPAHQRPNSGEYLPVRLGNLWTRWLKKFRIVRKALDRIDQLGHAPVLTGDQGNDGKTQGGFQHVGFHLDTLALSHIHHIQGEYHGDGQHQEFGQQVKVTFQGRCVRHHNHQVGMLMQDKVSRHPFLG